MAENGIEEVATPDEIAELTHNCPSGAIQYRRLDGSHRKVRFRAG